MCASGRSSKSKGVNQSATVAGWRSSRRIAAWIRLGGPLGWGPNSVVSHLPGQKASAKVGHSGFVSLRFRTGIQNWDSELRAVRAETIRFSEGYASGIEGMVLVADVAVKVRKEIIGILHSRPKSP